MLFNSLHFLLFFPIVAAVYFALPPRFRTWFLLAASYYFYMSWQPIYILIIILITLIDYYAALKIERLKDEGSRRRYLLLCLGCNLGLLIGFKSSLIRNANVNLLLNYLAVEWHMKYFALVMPMGLSFHTFQSMGYVVDVYRRSRPAERRLHLYALYVSYFPQMVSGPIERSTGLLTRLGERYEFDYERVTAGLRRMAWGFFLKMVVADNLAAFVDSAYASPAHSAPFALLKATYYFGIQIYCDFYGYTEIARGAAEVLGPTLMVNFNHPYAATSIRDFWHRWHISLSSWFRDYLYLPLGGNHVGRLQWGFNVMVVFLISGLWHGFSWTFFAWGALHGSYLIFGAATDTYRAAIARATGIERFPALHRAWKTFATFQLVTFAWIFFRARTLADGLLVVRAIFSGLTHFLTRSPAFLWKTPLTAHEIIVWPMIVLMFFVERRRENSSIRAFSAPVRWACYCGLILSILVLGRLHAHSFIYFDF